MSAPIKQMKKCQFNAYMNSKYLPFYLSLTMATAIYHHFTYDRNIYIYILFIVWNWNWWRSYQTSVHVRAMHMEWWDLCNGLWQVVGGCPHSVTVLETSFSLISHDTLYNVCSIRFCRSNFEHRQQLTMQQTGQILEGYTPTSLHSCSRPTHHKRSSFLEYSNWAALLTPI